MKPPVPHASGLLWTVSGARKGVGKTFLARRLCSILPGSLYAKHGCGPRKRGKPSPFFSSETDLLAFIRSELPARRHLVVESNSLALKQTGDIIIFVEAPPGTADVRPDAETLRRNAHIRLAPGEAPAAWRSVLESKLPPPLASRVLRLLQEHPAADAAVSASLQPRSKVWLVNPEGRVFGPGLARLLAETSRRGSLTGAARALGISYKHAWNEITEAEKRLGKPLLSRRPGGPRGGGSELTPFGRSLLSLHERLNGDVARFADRRFRSLYSSLFPEQAQ